MAEFVLVIPILLLLFVGVADLGRLFVAGVVIEAAARNAAEIVAQEYQRNPPPVTPPFSEYYANLRRIAATGACAEARPLPSTDYNAGQCPSQPIVRTCIHDGQDPECGAAVPGFASSVPPQCPDTAAGMSNTQTGDTEPSRYVEVRICYQFQPILRLPLLPLGDIFLERTRMFTVVDY